MASKLKYLSKSVKFGTKTLTMYSLDGLTWSSKRDELVIIKERQAAQKVSLDIGNKPTKEAKEEEKAKAAAKPAVPAPVVKPKPKVKYKPRVAEVIPLPPGVKSGWTPSEKVFDVPKLEAKKIKIDKKAPEKVVIGKKQPLKVVKKEETTKPKLLLKNRLISRKAKLVRKLKDKTKNKLKKKAA